jgi:hypothetical protein
MSGRHVEKSQMFFSEEQNERLLCLRLPDGCGLGLKAGLAAETKVFLRNCSPPKAQ